MEDDVSPEAVWLAVKDTIRYTENACLIFDDTVLDKRHSFHMDSTSLHVDGKYNSGDESAAEGVVHIRKGPQPRPPARPEPGGPAAHHRKPGGHPAADAVVGREHQRPGRFPRSCPAAQRTTPSRRPAILGRRQRPVRQKDAAGTWGNDMGQPGAQQFSVWLKHRHSGMDCRNPVPRTVTCRCVSV